MPTNHAAATIDHVFVLMLENRSFDHMLGFSGLTGTDAVGGAATTISGLSGTEFNDFEAARFPVTQPADFVMPIDPAHEFKDVLIQLCGPAANYPPGGSYPNVNCGGFVADYAANGGNSSRAEIMKCYAAGQLPVLTALAGEFAVLDNWFSSLPGPTWPNRFFAHGASSGGLDHSPTTGQILSWETFFGFRIDKGTIFDSLSAAFGRDGWSIYSGDDFPNVGALKGIKAFDIKALNDFAADVASASYSARYTFIEPNYGDVAFGTFRGGNSQHPMDDVTHGEALIKTVYEAIRASPRWTSSMLIVTWDEHGGFFDHVPPPAAVAPGDQTVMNGANQFGFTFEQYGPRVPALAISPLIPRNIIDHRLYDHASIPATVEAVFGLAPLTQRDSQANNLTSLASLAEPRTNCPVTLPAPAVSPAAAAAVIAAPPAARAVETVDQGNLPGFLHAALRSDLDLSPPTMRDAILARFATIKTRADAQRYLDEVRSKVHAGRIASKAARRA
jgi:phospholipase C